MELFWKVASVKASKLISDKFELLLRKQWNNNGRTRMMLTKNHLEWTAEVNMA